MSYRDMDPPSAYAAYCAREVDAEQHSEAIADEIGTALNRALHGWPRTTRVDQIVDELIVAVVDAKLAREARLRAEEDAR